MKIKLTSIKHAVFASEETHCYQAVIWIDGKRFANVQNDGHGGCDDVYPLDSVKVDDLPKWRDALKAVEAKLGETIIKSDSIKDFEYPNNLEHECGEFMNNWLQEKEIKRILKKICYVDDTCRFGEVYVRPARQKPTPVNIALLKQAPWWKPGNIILNELPIDKVKKYI